MAVRVGRRSWTDVVGRETEDDQTLQPRIRWQTDRDGSTLNIAAAGGMTDPQSSAGWMTSHGGAELRRAG